MESKGRDKKKEGVSKESCQDSRNCPALPLLLVLPLWSQAERQDRYTE
jgi:hypothetical protein